MNFKSTIAILLCITHMLLFAQQSEAFCIYNKSNKRIIVEQITSYWTEKNSRAFHQTLEPHSSKGVCCNFKTTSCNPTGDRNAKLTMRGFIDTVKFEFTLQAGGWIDFSEFGTQLHYSTYASDGAFLGVSDWFLQE